jgi:hypothetical protein
MEGLPDWLQNLTAEELVEASWQPTLSNPPNKGEEGTVPQRHKS